MEDQDQEQQGCKNFPKIESFSYSWLVNFPYLESMENNSTTRTSISVDPYDVDDSCSFIEMDPRLPPSRRFYDVSPKDRSFKFATTSSESLPHADELFRDGYVMPLFINNSNNESQPLDLPAMRSTTVGLKKSKSSSCSRRFRRVSRWVLLKYIDDFLTPLCRRIRKSCKASRSSGSNGRNRVYDNSDETTSYSPRISVVDDVWRRSCDSESSIYEAVLHCKKSFGK